MISSITIRLSNPQREFIFNRKLDNIMSWPGRSYVRIYEEPHGKFEVFTVPFGKSLAHEILIVKESRDGFHRVNFHSKPKNPDFWMEDWDLRSRGTVEVLFLCFVVGPFMILWNRLKPKRSVQS